jgi:hypothetical protein
MELHARIEQRAGGFRVVADVAAVGKQEVGPFSARVEAKIQEIKVRMDLRLHAPQDPRTA